MAAPRRVSNYPPPPREPRGSPGPSPPRHRARWVLAALLAAVIVVAAVEFVPGLLHPGGPAGGGGSGTTARTTLTISSSGGGMVSDQFLGLNVRPDASFGTYEQSLVLGTTVTLLRWPGGGLADRYNGTAFGGQGVIYNDDGTNYTATASLTSFAAWCLSVRCSVIYTLPAEIADPSAAAYMVAWIEGHLGLHPAYWEVGNEPALWTHFGIPWSGWSTSQAISPTASAFASLAESYAIAIHRVDPTARILGMGGLGKGGAQERTWINTTLQDGLQAGVESFAGVAVHVYPPGAGYPGESDEQVYASLDGSSSLTSRLGADWAAVRSNCGSCVLLADEVGAGTGNALSSFMTGFPMASFTAAEVIQGMESNVTSLDYFVLEGGYPGAWTPASGANPHEVYALYQTLLAKLGPTWLPVVANPSVPNLFAIATSGPAGEVLFVVNCDQNRSVGLDLAGSGFPLSSAGSAWSWGPSNTTPTGSSWSQGGPTSWTLAPEGLLLLVSSSPFQLSAAPSLVGAPAGASPASLQPPPPGGLPWTSEGLAFWQLSEPPVLLSRGGRLASFI